VNVNSVMYYLNLTPPAAPPSNLGPNTRPQWFWVSGGHSYEWHDGRMQDLAAVALAPGARYVGRWIIPVLVDGRRLAITGTLWYSPDPPLVWFWPIFVVLACLGAGLRLRRPTLDRALMRGLATLSLIGFVVLAIGRGLHGRPDVSAFALAQLAIQLVLAALAARWLLRSRQPDWLGLMLIGGVAAWAGLTTLGVLLHGYVLLAVPGPAGRAATSVCLATGPVLVLLSVRLAFTSIDSEAPGGIEPADARQPDRTAVAPTVESTATGA
jgi:hypothetical protein